MIDIRGCLANLFTWPWQWKMPRPASDAALRSTVSGLGHEALWYGCQIGLGQFYHHVEKNNSKGWFLFILKNAQLKNTVFTLKTFVHISSQLTLAARIQTQKPDQTEKNHTPFLSLDLSDFSQKPLSLYKDTPIRSASGPCLLHATKTTKEASLPLCSSSCLEHSYYVGL